MVRTRTAAELLRELDEEGLFAPEAALVVRTGNGYVLIRANDPDRNREMARWLERGGEPVGILRQSSNGVGLRVFCEYSDDDDARNVLTALSQLGKIPPPDDGEEIC